MVNKTTEATLEQWFMEGWKQMSVEAQVDLRRSCWTLFYEWDKNTWGNTTAFTENIFLLLSGLQREDFSPRGMKYLLLF